LDDPIICKYLKENIDTQSPIPQLDLMTSVALIAHGVVSSKESWKTLRSVCPYFPPWSQVERKINELLLPLCGELQLINGGISGVKVKYETMLQLTFREMLSHLEDQLLQLISQVYQSPNKLHFL
jgi:hypothetical protein